MRTIETKAIVSEDGELTIKVPPDVKPGEHRVTLMIDDAEEKKPEDASELIVIDVDAWPENFSLRREDLYGDDGR